MGECILEVKNITKIFPEAVALSDVSMQFRGGEVHALLGENGAGKSTLIKILCGAYLPTEGQIFMEGQELPKLNVKKAQALGIVAIHQELNLIPGLTVAENVFLGKEKIGVLGMVDKRYTIRKTKELFERFKIDLDPTAVVSNLSVAQQQIVEIGKALQMESKVVILDEPTDVLTDKETVVLFDIIRELKAAGKALIYISHRLDELPEICDTFSVLRDGHYMGSGNIGDCTKADIIRLMIGRDLSEQYPYVPGKPGDVVLNIHDVKRKNFGDKVQLEARSGEVLGLYGLVGSGRTELMKCILGIEKPESGEFILNGSHFEAKSVSKAHKAGIYYLTEDRKKEGIVTNTPVDFNMTLPSLQEIQNGFILSNKKEQKLCSSMVKQLSVKTPSLKYEIQQLSGGNQQKVLIAKALITKPKLLILDEPTRGIDVGTKRDIYQIINELKASGVAVIVISSELPEIMGISDRIVVFHDGVITGEFSHNEATEEAITLCAFGTKKESVAV